MVISKTNIRVILKKIFESAPNNSDTSTTDDYSGIQQEGKRNIRKKLNFII